MERLLSNIEDSYKWAKETVAALKAGDFAAVDMEALIDEIQSLYIHVELEAASALRDILEALLAKQFDACTEQTDGQLIRAQVRLRSLLDSHPTFHLTRTMVNAAYREARKWVFDDCRIELPDRCPFRMEQILEDPIARLVAEGRLAK